VARLEGHLGVAGDLCDAEVAVAALELEPLGGIEDEVAERQLCADSAEGARQDGRAVLDDDGRRGSRGNLDDHVDGVAGSEDAQPVGTLHDDGAAHLLDPHGVGGVAVARPVRVARRHGHRDVVARGRDELDPAHLDVYANGGRTVDGERLHRTHPW
jgi:hypothetical protein